MKQEIERKFLVKSLPDLSKLQSVVYERSYLYQGSGIELRVQAKGDRHEPEITIKVYHGHFEGLVRAEVEFMTEKEAAHFIPPDWFGNEITDTPLGRDSRIVELSSKELNKLLQSYT